MSCHCRLLYLCRVGGGARINLRRADSDRDCRTYRPSTRRDFRMGARVPTSGFQPRNQELISTIPKDTATSGQAPPSRIRSLIETLCAPRRSAKRICVAGLVQPPDENDRSPEQLLPCPRAYSPPDTISSNAAPKITSQLQQRMVCCWTSSQSRIVS